MGKSAMYSLTSGRIEATFEEALASLQNYGFRQSVFEVERLDAPKRGAAGERAARGVTAKEIIVLRPSSTQVAYPLVKPGDRVRCTGLGREASESPALYRVRRMAEGFSRRTMTVRT